MTPTNPSNPAPQTHPTGERRAELERIRDAVWPPNESPEERKAFLDELRSSIKDCSFCPLPVRERMIPKTGGKLRRLFWAYW